jgi:hypothetical protein
MKRIAAAAALLLAGTAMAQDSATVAPPAAIVADGIPPVPQALADATRPYMESRSSAFGGWNPVTRGVLIATRFGNTVQAHEVAMPMGARRQLSFEADAIARASYAPKRGDVMVVQKDVGGSEFWQLYTLRDGRLTLLTDGKSRNAINERSNPWGRCLPKALR